MTSSAPNLLSLTSPSSLSQHLQSLAPNVSYQIIRSSPLLREFFLKNALPNRMDFSQESYLISLFRSETDTIYECILGKSQLMMASTAKSSLQNPPQTPSSSKSSTLLNSLDSLFEGSSATDLPLSSNSTAPPHAPISAPQDATTILPLLKYLVESLQIELNVARYSSTGRTLLHYLICCADSHVSFQVRLECAKYLIGKGALPLHDTIDAENPVHSMCHIFTQQTELGTLLRNEKECDAAMHLVEVLLEARSECMHEHSKSGDTPLHVLAHYMKHGDKTCRKLLHLFVSRGGNLEEKDAEGRSFVQIVQDEALLEELREEYGVVAQDKGSAPQPQQQHDETLLAVDANEDDDSHQSLSGQAPNSSTKAAAAELDNFF